MTEMLSVVTDQGTAMGEATLCSVHYADLQLRGFAEFVAAGAEDVHLPLVWGVSTGNDAVQCVECGAPDDGTSGQDRESYSDDQDRDSYSVSDVRVKR